MELQLVSVESEAYDAEKPTHDCDVAGVPQGLPIRRGDLLKFSEILSAATCERLKRSTLGGALVFDRENF